MPETPPTLLPHLARTLRAAREMAGKTQEDVLAALRPSRATRDGGGPVKRDLNTSAALSRFESGQHWPGDPDRLVSGYARATGKAEQALWREALNRYENASRHPDAERVAVRHVRGAKRR